MKKIKSVLKHTVLFFALFLFAANFSPAVYSQTADLSQAKASITFDDGYLSTYQYALPILTERNIPATIYISTSLLGGTYDGQPMMEWSQVESLQNDYGWEVGSHSVTHPELTLLTAPQITEELINSKTDLEAHGFAVSNFSTPYGDYNNTVLSEIFKYYYSHRGFADRDALNIFPYNRAVLQVQSVEEGVTPLIVQGWIDQAIAQKQWLILVFHEVEPTSDPNYEYTVTTADFTAMMDYIVNSGIKVETVKNVSTIPGVNTLVNSSFENGLADSWATDNATQVTLDTNNNGSYPNPQNSVQMTGFSTSSHLFSNLIAAVPGADYLLEAFYSTIGLSTGELGFYIDEYDVYNNWISGQWLGLVNNNTIGYFTKLYNATSNLVDKLRVQVYLTGGSNGTAYVDNISLHDLNGTETPTVTPSVTPSIIPSETPSVTPSITPSVTLTPTGVNLISNPSFENGIAEGWTTDNAAQVTLDTDNHGSSPSAMQSVKMAGSANSSHLFFGLLTIDPAANYLLQTYINTTGVIAGELGFYVDEYDTAGNWISGRWLGAVVNGAITNFKYVYTATSGLVNQIRVQTYIFRGTNGTAYVDNYGLYDQSTNGSTPTPTLIPSPMPTLTPTVTPSPEPSLTPTPAVEPTLTPTPTVLPTPTIIPTVTPTVTPAPEQNLVLNGSFEELTDNWAVNWILYSGVYTIDVSNNGNDGSNSLHLLANNPLSHTLSARITVDSNTTYTWKQYVKAVGNSGEFGFYIDEYDQSGNWISGQWKGEIKSSFTGIKEFSYIPSSSMVKSINLQYYALTGSMLDVYLDSVYLVK